MSNYPNNQNPSAYGKKPEQLGSSPNNPYARGAGGHAYPQAPTAPMPNSVFSYHPAQVAGIPAAAMHPQMMLPPSGSPYSGNFPYQTPGMIAQPPPMYGMHPGAGQPNIHPNMPPTGPPPSYGYGPQYPTGYCPPPAYQSPIQYSQVPQQNRQPAAVFDAGARFGSHGDGSMNVPPPPPGYAPTAAQIASMQGHSVPMVKKANKFW